MCALFFFVRLYGRRHLDHGLRRRRAFFARQPHIALALAIMAGFQVTLYGRFWVAPKAYDWPYKHLGDSQGKVTPRSFIKLFVEAAKFDQAPALQVISAKGIQHGLREASKVRVDQLGLEYKWVKRALAPLAGIAVPCEPEAIFHRWSESDTVKVILDAASDDQNGFLPPFPVPSKGNEFVLLANAMQHIGLISVREDNRIDIPDLFRAAAMMLRRGGVPPRQKT